MHSCTHSLTRDFLRPAWPGSIMRKFPRNHCSQTQNLNLSQLLCLGRSLTPLPLTLLLIFDECFALCTHRKISWGNIHQKHKLKNRTTRPETIHYRYKCCVTSTNPHDSRHPLSGGVGTGLEIVCTGLRVVNQVDDCAKVDDCARWSL